ncbi:hypothetical protein NITLEN_20264 [Nitrospira lenta]|uniref:Uncharacterized protein n=1 Tax=Nitrospira lenta TaxID=1436998 RepID=A0A330L481_9BACT|nr:hypothetical protein NITLEN_20264 [Nitrospira lenta]
MFHGTSDVVCFYLPSILHPCP